MQEGNREHGRRKKSRPKTKKKNLREQKKQKEESRAEPRISLLYGSMTRQRGDEEILRGGADISFARDIN